MLHCASWLEIVAIFGDIRFLIQKMRITSVEAAETIHDKFFPHDALSDTAKEVVRDAIQSSRP
jgi:hypothetical protein